MVTSPQERELRRKMAAATTLNEQVEIDRQIQALRNSERDARLAEREYDWSQVAHHVSASQTYSAADTSVHVFSRQSSDLSWMDSITVDTLPKNVLSAKVRAAAVKWFGTVPPEFIASDTQFDASRSYALASITAEYGVQGDQAGETFIEQTDFLRKKAGYTKKADAYYSGPPHPDYPGMVWSDADDPNPSIERDVVAAINQSTTPADAVAGIMAVLDNAGYDSMDREMAFWIASQTKGYDYDDLYDAWMDGHTDPQSGRWVAASIKVADDFWSEIDDQIARISQATSAQQVVDILNDPKYVAIQAQGIDYSGDAFFAGSGGDSSMIEALRAAGWQVTNFEGGYYFEAYAPDGSGLTYTEGDVDLKDPTTTASVKQADQDSASDDTSQCSGSGNKIQPADVAPISQNDDGSVQHNAVCPDCGQTVALNKDTKQLAPHTASSVKQAIYHEMYGEVTGPQLAAYRKYNVSPADHDMLVDMVGDDPATITKAVQAFSPNGLFSWLALSDALRDYDDDLDAAIADEYGYRTSSTNWDKWAVKQATKFQPTSDDGEVGPVFDDLPSAADFTVAKGDGWRIVYLTDDQTDQTPSTATSASASLKVQADASAVKPGVTDENRCYACDGTGLSSQGWSGNPSSDGVTCPDCNGTGIDRTPYGTGSDHCAWCGADWRGSHDQGCPAGSDVEASINLALADVTGVDRSKTASGPVKAIVITPPGTGRAAGTTIAQVSINGLDDLQTAVKGYIEPVQLSNGVTMYVNEDGLSQFTKDDVNWVAGDVAGLGGQPQFMMSQPILGPVVLIGFDESTGDSADVPDIAMRWCQRVGREAGANFVTSSQKTAADYEDGDFSGPGYYLVTYGGDPAPQGPYSTISELAQATDLTDYPDDGYVVVLGSDGRITTVPSLNPDVSRKTAETNPPYYIKQQGSQWTVVNSNGDVKGTFDTKDEARQQQKALYANVPGASEKAERKSESTSRNGDNRPRLSAPKTADVDTCQRCYGKGWVPMVWTDTDGEVMRGDRDCPDCGGSGVEQDSPDYPLSDDPIYERYSSVKAGNEIKQHTAAVSTMQWTPGDESWLGPLDVWAQNWLGQRFRITFADGEMDWGKFVGVANGEAEWLSDRADSNGVSYPLDASQVESVVPVSEMDPPGQDALFDKQPYDLTASRKQAGDGTSVEVSSYPDCDIHTYQLGQPGVEAHYDGKTIMGPWANMCDECFAQYGVGLGVGQGQRLVVP